MRDNLKLLSGFLHRVSNLIKRTISARRIDPADKARLRSMARIHYLAAVRFLGIDTLACPKIEPASQLDDVFIWAVIDWHFRTQRPQHIASALARKGHRVFYISNNFIDSTAPGFAAEALEHGERLFQISLHVTGAPQIYSDLASPPQALEIARSLGVLLQWTHTRRSIALIQHPYWLDSAQRLPNAQLVYDCMDHHGGFGNNGSSILEAEQLLITRCDLLVVTSQWLHDRLAPRARKTVLIRNATEYEHFSAKPQKTFRDTLSRKIIGYYGAIAEWFDVELVRQVAQNHPDALVLLIGRDTIHAHGQLVGIPNVTLVGEVPYAELPYWLHSFDVCLLPFRVTPLTLATNPVKVYEYLSAGKPVVSVDLPEMAQFDGLITRAGSFAEFCRAVTAALAGSFDEPAAVTARKEFAARQTWEHRTADLKAVLGQLKHNTGLLA